MFVAYRLTILKVFPSLFANSVWLIPLASNTSFIRFIRIFYLLLLLIGHKGTKFYLVNGSFLEKKVLPLHQTKRYLKKQDWEIQ